MQSAPSLVNPANQSKHAQAMLFDKTQSLFFSFAVDKFIYWSDVEAFEIKRAKTDGTGIYWMWMSNFALFLHETWLLAQSVPYFFLLMFPYKPETLLEHCKLQRSVLALKKGLFR